MGAKMVKEVGQQDLRRRRRRHHHRHGAGRGDLPRGPAVTSPPAPNPIALERGIDKAVERRRREDRADGAKRRRQGASIAQVAHHLAPTTTPTIGKIIAEAMDKVGKDGVITVEEGKSLETDDRRRRGHAVRPRLPRRRTSSPTPTR
jgi:hypothetical protein